MGHPYFKQYHDPNDEPSAEPIDIDIELDLSIDQWRKMIWTEIEDFQNAKNEKKVTSSASS